MVGLNYLLTMTSENAAKKYVVVLFEEDNTVQTIPSSWIAEVCINSIICFEMSLLSMNSGHSLSLLVNLTDYVHDYILVYNRLGTPWTLGTSVVTPKHIGQL